MAGKTVDPQKIRRIATTLYKHQNFNNRALQERIGTTDYSWATVISYVSGLRNFIRTGEADPKRAPKEFYTHVQELKDTHCAILTPSEDDKLTQYWSRTPKNPKSGKVKVTKTVDSVSDSPVKDSTKIHLSTSTLEKLKEQSEKIKTVGVLYDGKILLMKNEDMLKGFQLFSSLVQDTEFEVIDITYSKRK